jgi:hypothetical protein
MKCPIATYDIKENLKKRNWAFKNVGYGPANPDEPNDDFWKARADEWNTDLDQAKTMRCGNCAAFIQTPEMIACITKGIEPDQEEDELTKDVINAADLGYCELFHFKCAAARTCSAWLRGGPITKPMTARQKNMVDMARTEYDTEDEGEYGDTEE